MGLSVEIHPTVGGIAFVGQMGAWRPRLTFLTLRLSDSDSVRGLEYSVCLDRASTYFEIAKADLRDAFPGYEMVDQHDGRRGECGRRYFRNVAEVEKCLAVLGVKDNQ